MSTATGAAGAGGNGGSPVSAAERYRKAVLDDEPLAYWRFEETEVSAPALDESDHDNHARYEALIVLQEEGAMEGSHAVRIPGNIDDIHMVADQPADFFVNDASFSAEAWINFDAAPTSVTYGILSDYAFTMGGGISWRITLSGALGFRVGDGMRSIGEETVALTSAPLSAQKWHHVVVTYDGAEVRQYVDGVLAPNAESGIPSTQVTGNGRDLVVGSLGVPGNSTSAFPGRIDDVAIYDAPLSDGRISAHYRAATEP